MTEREMIDQFIRERGVTRCPAAYVAYTQAQLSDEDRAAHRARGYDPFTVTDKWQRMRRSQTIGAKRGGESRPVKATLR